MGWLDNDPHFWTNPPTWGICRTDLRRLVNPGDHVFFVLPAHGTLPQMVYGYLRVKERLSHIQAFHRPSLRTKRMRPSIPGRPNGNIIVTAQGGYNPLDGNEDHETRFNSIKQHYIVGDQRRSRFLSEQDIERLHPTFMTTINRVFGEDGRTPIDVISRWGRLMDEDQVKLVLAWLDGSEGAR